MKTATSFGCSVVTTLLVTSVSSGGLVWQAGFGTNNDPEGFTEYQNGNLNKDLFAGPVSGNLIVTTTDGVAFGGEHDKGGRALNAGHIPQTNPLPINPLTDDFSAYYKFRWQTWHSGDSQTWNYAGFLGDGVAGGEGEVHVSSEAAGALFNMSESGGDALLQLGAFWADRRTISSSNLLFADPISLGPAADIATQEFQLGIFWNESTQKLIATLYDSAGNILSSANNHLPTNRADWMSADPATVEQAISANKLTHLGWQDYVARRSNQNIIWTADEVRYYNDALGPAGDGTVPEVPEPAAILLLASGGLALLCRRRQRGMV